jgi:hypothetical protein
VVFAASGRGPGAGRPGASNALYEMRLLVSARAFSAAETLRKQTTHEDS